MGQHAQPEEPDPHPAEPALRFKVVDRKCVPASVQAELEAKVNTPEMLAAWAAYAELKRRKDADRLLEAYGHMRAVDVVRMLDRRGVGVPIVGVAPDARASSPRGREQGRGRSRVTRAGPGDDPDPEPPASPFQSAHRALLRLTARELDVLVDVAARRGLILRAGRWSA